MRSFLPSLPTLGLSGLTALCSLGALPGAWAAEASQTTTPPTKSKIDLTPFEKRKRVRPAPVEPATGPLEKNPFISLKSRKAPEPLGSPIPKGQRITRKTGGRLPVLGEGTTKLPSHSFELRTLASGGYELGFQSAEGTHRWDSAKPFAIQILTSWGLSAKPNILLDTDAPASLKAAPFSLPVTLKVTQPGVALQPIRVVASYRVCPAAGGACQMAMSKRSYTAEELGLVPAPAPVRKQK